MKKRSLWFAVVAGALLLGMAAQAEVKWMDASSPRAQKVLAAQAAREEASSRSIMLRSESWTGTRAIIWDEASKTLRRPTAAEVAQMVRSLRVMTSKPVRTITPVTTSNGTRQGSIEGEHANVVIARATEGGGYETLCVQTFEEAAEFLGLKRSAPGTGSGK